MPLRVYNSLTREKEIFTPVEPGHIRMYVCGPTVYDACHIGHARSVVVYDVIARYLRSIGYDTTYVRNFTDVDDKIINRANELGIDCKTLSEKFIQEFYEDMDALYVERASFEPRATEHMDRIIRIIEALFGKGLAYQAGTDVFFKVRDFSLYGKLSGRKLDELEAGARIDIDEKKESPHDFALWKGSKADEPAWDSPWGKGRPGWHIECSAMSMAYLGETIDIHGGGKDLIFPHHENEIAQSEGASDKPFVKYWIHNGFVNINHEKMSKSLGNFMMVKDVLKAFHPEAVRLFLLSSHYRSPVDFTDQAIDDVSAGLDKMYAFIERVAKALELPSPGPRERGADQNGDTFAAFKDAMDDDFNTAKGIGVVFEAIRKGNRLLDGMADLSGEQAAGEVKEIYADLMRIGQVLGLYNETPDAYFENKRLNGIQEQPIDSSTVEKLIAERTDARKNRDWKRADDIRDELAAKNIILEDRADGTVWKMK